MRYSILVYILMLIFIVSGCKKASQDPVPVVPTTPATPAPIQNQAADDNSQADYIFNDINNIVDDASRSEGGVNKVAGNYCYTTTKDSTSSTGYPQTVTVDFGDGCKSADGKTRKGKIVFVVTQKRTTLKALDSISFVNFYIDNYKIDGAITNRLDSISPQGVACKWTYEVKGGEIADVTTKKFHKWYAKKTRIVYYNLPDPIYWFYGGMSGGTNVNNETYTSNITKTIKVINCSGLGYIASSGSFKLLILDAINNNAIKSSLEIDYGNDTCDKLATAIINGGSPTTVSFK